jgi:hypothetical protein
MAGEQIVRFWARRKYRIVQLGEGALASACLAAVHRYCSSQANGLQWMSGVGLLGFLT